MKLTTRIDIGLKKKSNEDQTLAIHLNNKEALIGVADGLGGQVGGEVASEIAINILREYQHENDSGDEAQILQLIYRANEKIIERGDREPELRGMGSTATVAVVRQDNVSWAHIGDSRLFHYRDTTLTQITRDQHLAQSLFDEGKINKLDKETHPLKHFLEQCLGEDDIEPSSGSFPVQQNDLMLTCTDGLHDMIHSRGILQVLNSDDDLDILADNLLAAAINAGAADNIGFVLARV